jgi:hypothetical protein
MSLHCDFCGLDFEPECTETVCTPCPLAQSCARVNCPRCGYAILPESALGRWLRNIRLPFSIKKRTGHEKPLD